ncbi:hypothetical protein [Nostoc sp.]
MESTLFTTLTASEEAIFSGGWKTKTPVKTPPKPTTPAPVVKPTVITQVAVNVVAGILSGTFSQTAVNDATAIASGSSVTQTALNVIGS